MHDRHGIGKKNVEERRLLKCFDEKELCEANTWFEKKEQRKIAYSMGEMKLRLILNWFIKTIESI